ncbi:MAG: bifunctional oligoribonuclease/PAP phosphatase NrnA [candidate division WOR-3 bacterium]|nr:MAG: bifunctional oligoribonuclease/PAP phosphatase NrnA [candidate division WOR-3 bacterium]
MHYSEKLVKIIRSNKRILIATHIDPDADGIAAALSCGYLVRHYKKRKPVLFCHSPIPSRYRFLLEGWKFSRKVPAFDVLLAVDSAGISRIFPDAAHVRAARLDEKMVINIDHHKSNNSFGALRIINEDASSACEIIYYIFKKLRIPINEDLASVFYCGIYSETGGFVYQNTTRESLEIASELIARGIEPSELVRKMNAKTLSGTLLLSRVLSTIEIEKGVAVMQLTQDMLRKSKARMVDSENFVSFLNAIKNVKVALFIREEKQGVRISLRSDGSIDVDQLARKYGGGGHRLAAGVRLSYDIKTARTEILRAIQRELKKV